MALSVAGFYKPADWFTTTGTSRPTTGVAWSSGDIIVCVGGAENNDVAIGAPTNANLTFGAAKASNDGTGGTDCSVYIYAATAGSSQTAQTIASVGVAAFRSGYGVWVITGSPTGTANASANLTEAAFTVNTTAGSVVIYGFFDWSANTTNQTQTTASGTATERYDFGDGVSYGGYGGEWVDVASGSQSWGVTSYTGTQVAHAVIEVLAPAASTPPPAHSLIYVNLDTAHNW